jgi:hypothetical protein
MAALKRMKPRDHGTIVQVGSALAYRSIPLQAAYCGAKSALRGFIDSLRSELIHDKSNVHVTMVHLSAFNTPQFDWGRSCMPGKPKPLGKIFQPELAARGIYWAATHRRRELWVGFPAVEAIVGTRLIPGFLDRKLAHDAWDGQQSKEQASPDRRDNLYTAGPLRYAGLVLGRRTVVGNAPYDRLCGVDSARVAGLGGCEFDVAATPEALMLPDEAPSSVLRPDAALAHLWSARSVHGN